MEITHLFVSAGHNYFGHHGKPAGSYPVREVATIECIAGRGIRGDRFFDYKHDYKGQITLFAEEVYETLCSEFQLGHNEVSALRRNVITRHQELNDLIGTEFELQGVRLLGVEECRPCYWMDQAVAPGVEQFLRGRGGLRARIMTSGIIRAAHQKPLS